MRMIDGGLVREGFGSYVEVEVNRHGELVAVHSRQTVTGEIKVVTPDADRLLARDGLRQHEHAQGRPCWRLGGASWSGGCENS